MPNIVTLSDRDFALLRFLEITPATASQIRRASETFPGEPFRDERRVRERLQSLTQAGFIKTCATAQFTGGTLHYYRLAASGFRAVHTDFDETIPKYTGTEIAPSRFQHAMITADVIVHLLVSCHRSRVTVTQASGDGRLTLEVGEYRQQPDCQFQLLFAGHTFNLLFEIDNATEPLDSRREQSIRSKILGYESYQDWVLQVWKNGGRVGPRPAFRVVFLTRSTDRANHMLYLAGELARNKSRRLVLATSQDQFLVASETVIEPILNDHFGHWQSIVNSQPTSPHNLRPPVRLQPPIATQRVV